MSSQPIHQLAQQKTLRTHLPVHGGHNLFLPPSLNQICRYDLSEITGLDDLHNPAGFIQEGQQATASLFQVEHSFWSVNGASAALMAACLSLGEGGKVLVPMNVHKSVLAGLILSGAEPVWYQPIWDEKWGVYRAIDHQQIQDLLLRHGGIKGCFVTAPTYEGIYPDLTDLVEVCHKHRVPVIADESHGAHLSLLYEGFGAINACADLIIHSAHKSLGALTQTGLLHLQSEFVSPAKIASSLSLLQTTSPSFVLLLSLAETIKSLSKSLEPLQKQLCLANTLRNQIEKIDGLHLVPNQDLTRLLISIDNVEGFALSDYLQQNDGYETELESKHWVMLILGLGSNRQSLYLLNKTLQKAANFGLNQASTISKQTISKPSLFQFQQSPRKAYLQKDELNLTFQRPPGIPSNIPGTDTKHSQSSKAGQDLELYFEEDFTNDMEDFLYGLGDSDEQESTCKNGLITIN